MTLDIIRLSSTLIKFDVLRILDQKHKYAVIVPDLISLLEFDKNNPEYSFAIAKIRDDNLEKNQNIFNKNRIFGGFKNIVGSVFTNFSEISKTLVGAVLGSSNEKTSGSGQGLEFIDYNDPLFYKNSLMRGLISIRNKLDLLKHDEENFSLTEINKEILIKMEICDLLIFFNDLRTDFLLSNFLKFFEEKLKKLNINDKMADKGALETLIINEIEEDAAAIIPTLLQTGILEVDLKYKSDTSLFNALEGAIDNVKLPLGKSNQKKGRSRKFQNFTEDFEMPDLDSLLGKKMDGSTKAEVLPSLILCFFLNKNPKLENKILEVIMKCFNQRKEFCEKVKELEILFDPNDIKLFHLVKKKIERLRMLTERSEV